jgi:hypothetical protein
VGFEVLTAVIIKSLIFWDVTDVSEEHATSIFRVEDKQEISR